MKNPIVLMTLLAVAAAGSQPPIAAAENEPMPEAPSTLRHDLESLRKTTLLPQKPPVRASSAEACVAAARIFDRLQFVGMEKETVLWILGDPATVSDYGIKAGSEIDAPLVYRFDGGFGGNDYRLEFNKGRVSEVKRIGVN